MNGGVEDMSSMNSLRDYHVDNAERRISLNEAHQDFILAKELEGLRDRTISDHELHFRYFEDFLKEKYPSLKFLDEITSTIIRGYIAYMKFTKRKWDNHQFIETRNEGLSDVTINIRLRSLRTFFNFLVKEGQIERSPFASVSLLKVDDELNEGLSKEELDRLFHVAKKKLRSFVGYRNYVILQVFLDTGMRVGETLALDEEDIDLDAGAISVEASNAKTRKGRTIPISKKTADLIKNLLEINKKLVDREPALFISVSGKRLDASEVRRFMLLYKKEAGVEKKASPHIYRHSYCKHYLLNGGDAYSLQKMVGHTNMETLKRYTKMNIGELKQQHDKYSPAK